MRRRSMLIVPFMLFGNVASAAEAPREASRGELLYSTHCEGCHNLDVHWRDKRVVTDWASLRLEVRRWQDVAGAGWGNEDIEEVARYLNALFYRFPATD